MPEVSWYLLPPCGRLHLLTSNSGFRYKAGPVPKESLEQVQRIESSFLAPVGLSLSPQSPYVPRGFGLTSFLPTEQVLKQD